VVFHIPFSHSAEALYGLKDWLLGFTGSDAHQIAVALQKPHGAVVDWLLMSEIDVYAISPRQWVRFTMRDRQDALVLAQVLRTGLHLFRRIHPLPPKIISLRELLRINKELCTEEVALTNRLREQLLRCLPHLLSLAPRNLMDPFFWDILERFGTQASKVDPQMVQTLLRRYRIRRISVQQLLESLRQPPLPVAAGTLEVVNLHMDLLVKRLRLVHEQRKHNANRLEERLEQFILIDEGTQRCSDAAILLSLPGVGTMVLATLLSHASEAIHKRDLPALRVLSGTAPVTRLKGRGRCVFMRRSCDSALKNAIYHWGRVAIHKDVRFRDHYTKLRASGHSHARALRGVMDRVLTIAIAMLRGGTFYAPSHRRDP
jgi:hypothetical protein